jgi:hypothetical protein
MPKPYKRYLVTHIVTKSYWAEALDEEEAISLAQDASKPDGFTEGWYATDLTMSQGDAIIKPHSTTRRKNYGV